MIDEPRLKKQLELQPFPLLFVTVTGSHLYGFPSADSRYELGGVHLLPLEQVVGLNTIHETVAQSIQEDGLALELITQDARVFFQMLLKNNGQVLEQILSPLIVHTTPEHAELIEITRKCITRHHAHHYLASAEAEWRLFKKENPPRVRPLLNVYRLLLTGIHLMRTGMLEANLLRLDETFKLPQIAELVQRKLAGPENTRLHPPDVRLHERDCDWLRGELEHAYWESTLPDAPAGTAALDALLVHLRLSKR